MGTAVPRDWERHTPSSGHSYSFRELGAGRPLPINPFGVTNSSLRIGGRTPNETDLALSSLTYPTNMAIRAVRPPSCVPAAEPRTVNFRCYEVIAGASTQWTALTNRSLRVSLDTLDLYLYCMGKSRRVNYLSRGTVEASVTGSCFQKRKGPVSRIQKNLGSLTSSWDGSALIKCLH